MANYYTDHPEIAFHLEHPQMKRLVELEYCGNIKAAKHIALNRTTILLSSLNEDPLLDEIVGNQSDCSWGES